MSARVFGSQGETSAFGLADGVEDGVHARFFDLVNVGQQLAEAALGKPALLEPSEVFDR